MSGAAAWVRARRKPLAVCAAGALAAWHLRSHPMHWLAVAPVLVFGYAAGAFDFRVSARERLLWALALAALLAMPMLAATGAGDFALPRISRRDMLAIVLCAAAAWGVSRRWSDAAAYALVIFGAAWTEPQLAALVMSLPLLVLLALSGRPRFSLVVGVALFCTGLAAMVAKERFGGSMLTWQDVRFFMRQFSDNVGVFGHQFTLVAYTALAMAAGAVALVQAWRREAAGPGGPMSRAARVCALLAVAGSFSSLDTWARQAADRFDSGAAWDLAEAEKPLYSRFLSTAYLEPRPDYRPVDTAALEAEIALLQQTSARPAGATPDIVVVLQESQVNPRLWSGCPGHLCAFPAFDAQPPVVDAGPLRVHTFGGGTWLSEFTVMTGVPHTVFGGAGAFASFNVAPQVSASLPRSLRARGYRTVAVYPVSGGMMNARAAYAGYGFDRFYDMNDIGLTAGWATSDEEMHAAALRVLERERQHGQPVFLFVVTIFNHSEHGVDLGRVPPDLVSQARAYAGGEKAGDTFADYLWRTRRFARALETTRRELSNSTRPAVLAWFGDHQPPFESAPDMIRRIGSGDPRIPPQMTTWYSVETLGRPSQPPRVRALDLAFLPGLLVERAGIAPDEWMAANIVASKHCNGLFAECAQPAWRDAYLTYLFERQRAFR